jgi:hypothetical protein
MTSDAIKEIQRHDGNTKIYAYTDDMVTASTLIQDLQHSFNDNPVGKPEQPAHRENRNDGLQERRESEAGRQNQLWLRMVKSGKVLQISVVHPSDWWQDLHPAQ